MVILARRFPRNDGPGFTLVELLLTVALLLGLLAAVVFNFWTLHSGASLDDGGRQFEALTRFAAAQAANSGRMVQFQFSDAPTGELLTGTRLHVMREVDPINQPGIFEDLPEAGPMLEELMQRVKISEVKGMERPANQGTNEIVMAEDVSALPPPITFYPDGSSDSADIVLDSRDPDDFRQMIIHLAGATGTIRTEVKVLDEITPIEWMEDETQTAAASTLTPARLPEQAEPVSNDTASTNAFPNDDWPK